jgi:uncharacterized protein (TIGR03085 family)
MAPTNHAQLERAALCDLFEQVGPDAPTLCAGWTTRDLAAHLVVRERRLDAALGILAAPLKAHAEKVRLHTADQPWPRLVELVRTGPPRRSLFGLPGVDRAANTTEYFIHHEDVRRALPDWAPRDLDPGLADDLWRTVSRMGRLMLRKAPVGVVLARPGEAPVTAHAATPLVEVLGPTSELAVFVNGRQAHAQVELSGSPDAVEALRTARFGI